MREDQMSRVREVEKPGGNWMSVKEYAVMKGVSERAIRKNIASGKYQVKEVPHPKRADQITYMVYAEPECGTSYAEPNAEPVMRNRMRNQNAEPECGTRSNH